MLYIPNQTINPGSNSWQESVQKTQMCPKNGFIVRRIKNFHKSKNDGLYLIISCIVRDAIIQI